MTILYRIDHSHAIDGAKVDFILIFMTTIRLTCRHFDTNPYFTTIFDYNYTEGVITTDDGRLYDVDLRILDPIVMTGDVSDFNDFDNDFLCHDMIFVARVYTYTPELHCPYIIYNSVDVHNTMNFDATFHDH